MDRLARFQPATHLITPAEAALFPNPPISAPLCPLPPRYQDLAHPPPPPPNLHPERGPEAGPRQFDLDLFVCLFIYHMAYSQHILLKKEHKGKMQNIEYKI